MDWVYGTGVNTELNYVWGNLTHFSDYTIAETIMESSQITLNSGWNLISLPVS